MPQNSDAGLQALADICSAAEGLPGLKGPAIGGCAQHRSEAKPGRAGSSAEKNQGAESPIKIAL
jgi:hypothetical protein